MAADGAVVRSTMRIRGKYFAASIASLVVAAPLALSVPAAGDVPVSQQVRAEQTRPRSGVYTLPFKNYARDRCLTSGPTQDIERCNGGYRKAEGVLRVRLTTFKVDENLGDDVYLVETVVKTAKVVGSSNVGTMSVRTVTKGPNLVSTSENRDLREDTGCDRVPLTLAVGVPGASVSATGNADFCSGLTSMARSDATKRRSTYTVTGLPGAQEVTLVRWVRVAAGERPNFTVTVRRPVDSCLRADDGWCMQFTDDVKARTFRIGTT